MGARVLIIDDDPIVRHTLSGMVQALKHEPIGAASGEEGIAQVKAQRPDLLLLDLNLPNVDGLDVLRAVKGEIPSLPVIFFSGSLSIQDTVEAMRLGAFHCMAKPFTLKDLERAVNQALSKTLVIKEIRCEGHPEIGMVVASDSMRRVSELIARISKSPAATVLLMGETGTGKEVVARYLHNLSERKDGAFVAVNCAAIPETLIESELFGHERGAFTDAKAPKKGLFEEAHEGTIFLDEIGELPLGMQAKLLRVLQERVVRRVGGSKDFNVDVRVIAATNVDLKEASADGRFREDLYYRLNVIPLQIPPLRDRKEDIVPLVEHFLQRFAKELGRAVRPLAEREKADLLAYHWPGNVRELRNCVERAVLLDLDRILGDTPGMITSSTPTPSRIEKPVPEYSLPVADFAVALEDPNLAAAERTLIMKVMQQVHGNKNQAAALLGINRTTLYRKLSSYGLEVGSVNGIS
ncbi:MAG: sigma-54-dependent Fis family transcriptional regulator [Planctomycetota bacterium]